MKTKILLAGFLMLSVFFANSQNKKAANNSIVDVELSCIAFYNLENLFDTIHDVGKNDYEYLPDGTNKWNTRKYTSKLHNMSYAISQIGLDRSPVGAVIIGVSEVENQRVLDDLVKQPRIADRNYQVVLHEGPDRRGVDVGLLYNPRYFTMSNSKSVRLNYAADTTFRTRDQLVVSGYLQNEKIHVIVNHWPSRTGGELRSRPLRNAAAALTRSIVDSLFNIEPKAKIIIMGDLNDDPADESCAVVLGAKRDANKVKDGELYNVFWKTHKSGTGTLLYNGKWNLFDQIIISSELLNADNNSLRFWKSEIFRRDFLLQQEGRYKGSPLRTTAGGVWLNGYSDHLPTIIYLVKKR